MLDLSLGKLLVVAVVALFLLGPDKLPGYAAQLGRWVRIARGVTDEAKRRMATELGPDFEDVDWASLDPRRYHPRRLIADAWNGRDAAEGPASEDEPRPVEVGDAEPDLLALADARAEQELLETRGPGRVA